ncbi:ATP-binding domain-containing protein [Paenibacillus sp. CC-CFT747]|nr:ATP-binding domain-containing protein [Paenibacillus sp. CC-CFT747]
MKSREKLPPEWEGICRYTLEALERGEMPYEDATPYVYLQAEVEGMQKYREMRHVLIDEAQDYSPFQYAYIRALFPKAGFTLLGDLNQGIQGEAGLQGYEGIRELLGGEEAKTVRLFKSYRSTRQIVDFTKALLGEGQPVEAFSRDGELPRLIRAQDDSALADAVAADVRSLRAEGASVAVLCHTAEESEQAFAALQKRGETDAVLITRETETFVTGTVVLPVYLAKGLEFDAVVVYEAGSRRYGRERERKLLYTACTRALHRLHLYYTGEPSPFLAGVPGSLFERQEA